MEARIVKLTQVLEMNNCFKIPIYQRTYDWRREHCKQLYDDIIKIGRDATDKVHFLGAITCVGENLVMSIPHYQVIDGQQRLTTIALLLRALRDRIDENTESVTKDQINQLLFNVNYKDDEHHKLTLTEADDQSLKDILEHGSTEESNNIAANFKYLMDKLSEENADYDIVWRGIRRLAVITLIIDEKGDAQAIFESMNSTGLDLSETDMIQNYVLMPHDEDTQKRIYKEYWRPMEQCFAEEPRQFSEFLRNYLMMHRGSIVPKNCMYAYFKIHMGNRDKEEEISNIYKYSKYYADLINITRHRSDEIRRVIKYVQDQDTNVPYSLLLKVLADHDSGTISEEETIKVFLLVDTYLLRCHVCELTKAGNKVFPEIIPKIDEKNYAESIERVLMSKIGNRRFPRDITFREKLEHLPLYTNNTMCRYMLGRLEHGNGKEQIDMDHVQIEHIMPRTLTKEWEKSLGNDFKDIYEKYLNTIGNLTLTGYNPVLGNDLFQIKCKTYRNSNIRITRELDKYENWGEDEIKKRTKLLTDEAVRIWKCPEEQENENPVDDETLESEYLDETDVAELWKKLKDHILSTCKDTAFHMTNVYGTFVLQTKNSDVGICSLEARKHMIHVTYNTKIRDKIISPSKAVRNISKVGHHGVGELRTTVRTEEDIAKSIELIKKVYEYKLRNSSKQ